MADMKFTPGPWHIVEGDSVVNVVAGTQALTATCTKPYYERFDEIDRANAHLIAAAPDLYAALLPLAEKGDCCTTTEIAAAQAALARARGESLEGKK